MIRILMDFGSEILWALSILIFIWDIRKRIREYKDLKLKIENCDRCIVYMQDYLRKYETRIEKRITGVINKTTLKAKTAEVLADRSFNMASSANLAIMALQRTLTVRPTFVPKKKQLENEVAQKEVMTAIGGTPDYSGFDWLRPILGPDELDIIDKAMEHAERFQNGDKEREE